MSTNQANQADAASTALAKAWAEYIDAKVLAAITAARVPEPPRKVYTAQDIKATSTLRDPQGLTDFVRAVTHDGRTVEVNVPSVMCLSALGQHQAIAQALVDKLNAEPS